MTLLLFKRKKDTTVNIRHIITGLAFSSAVLASSVSLAAAPAMKTQSQFNPNQVKAIETVVHNYLIKNPEVLVAASRALQVKEMQKQQQAAVGAIEANKADIFNNPNTPTAGNPNGNVYLVEFFDYQCGHCKTMNSVIQSVIKSNKNVKVIFKELPIFGANSQFAAKAALAANQQGKYFAMHDALLNASNPLSKAKVLQIASKAGVNVTKMEQAMQSQTVNQQIRDNFQLARKLKLMGTPAFIIANKAMTQFRFIPGATTQADLQRQFQSVSQMNNANS